MKKLVLIIFIFCLIPFGVQNLNGDNSITYKVKVPVKLTNVCSDIRQVRIDCQASSEVGFTQGSVVAHGKSKPHYLDKQGSLNYQFEINMLTYNTKIDKLAKSYYCYLSAKYKGEWIMYALIINQDKNCVNKTGTPIKVTHYGHFE
jgi:hypothetical protein